ncbi:MAG TPA: CdaR family protein [Terriglobales bacterium]
MSAGEFVRRHIIHNFGLKILSVLLAAALWFVITSNPPAEVALDVAIVFKNMPADLEISSENVPSEQIRVRGPQRLIGRLQASDIHAEIDLTGMKPGERTFDLTADQIHLPDQLRIVQIIPGQLHLAFDREAVREVPVHPRVVGTFAPGYEVRRVVADPPTVRISGPQKQVHSVEDAITDPVDVSGIMDRHSFSTHAYVSDPLIQVVDSRPVQVTVIMERAPLPPAINETKPE